MNQCPFVTGDGLLVHAGEVHLHDVLDAPQLFGTLRFTNTNDALRGLVRDLASRAVAEGKPFTDYCALSGRSGHSRIGIDIELLPDQPEISDSRRTIEVQVRISALNRNLDDALSTLQDMAEQSPVGMGRLFIPRSEPLDADAIAAARKERQLMLPEGCDISPDGVIDIPLQNVRYVCSQRLLSIPKNFQEILSMGKHGLNLVQHRAPMGLPETIQPGEFLVSAMRISLGPFTAFIERDLNIPGVFHLASRLLDGVRTSGMHIDRHVELYNSGEAEASADELRVRVRLYPADEKASRIAKRLLTPDRAERILNSGVDVGDITDIFDTESYGRLFDEITPSPLQGGHYGRIYIPRKLLTIPWEHMDGGWIPEFQWRLVYEAARGNLPRGVLSGDEVPARFRRFLEELAYVGGEHKLSKVFVTHTLPPVDTLRVLKRNGIGVVAVCSLHQRNGESWEENGPEYFMDQATYEELVRLEGEGMRFYMAFGRGDTTHVREFYHGLWVTRRGHERLHDIHTTLAVFGSAVGETHDQFVSPFKEFLADLQQDPRLGDNFAVAHGSGPGVMKAVDDAAAELGIFRMGVGIEAEKIGQVSNFAPEALVQFVGMAMNTRQDILDRRSIFKIFNVGGFGTSYEINMALTFMKINHCLPAPYVFVDPYGLGDNGGHLWEGAMRQFQTITTPRKAGDVTVGPLGPEWITRCCHLVCSYAAGREVISAFLDDPAGYWRQAGVSPTTVRAARDNLVSAGIVMPPYVEKGLLEFEADPEGASEEAREKWRKFAVKQEFHCA